VHLDDVQDLIHTIDGKAMNKYIIGTFTQRWLPYEDRNITIVTDDDFELLFLLTATNIRRGKIDDKSNYIERFKNVEMISFSNYIHHYTSIYKGTKDVDMNEIKKWINSDRSSDPPKFKKTIFDKDDQKKYVGLLNALHNKIMNKK